jgi:two-component system capsular synthesis response regulator RcsB
MIRVIVTDDHPVVLIGVKATLERQEDIRVVGEASNGDELVSLLEQQPCDVIITDYSMPDMEGSGPGSAKGARHNDGLALVERLIKRHPGVPLILYTMVNNVGVLRTLQDKGVKGFADKRSPMGELVYAVRSVVQGKSFMSTSLRERFEQSERESPTQTTNVLSPREVEVFRLCAEGHTVTAIAERLCRSVKTVSTQKRQAMKKLGLGNHSELVKYAETHGMISS